MIFGIFTHKWCCFGKYICDIYYVALAINAMTRPIVLLSDYLLSTCYMVEYQYNIGEVELCLKYL